MLVPLAVLAPLVCGAVAAPITAVTVYSDRARVTRTASVVLHGTETIELPLLLDTADTSTIRLDARHAEVRRVDIAHVAAEAVPADQARALLEQIQKLDDQTATLRAQDEAYAAQLNELQRLSPALPPADPQHPPAKLNPAGWASVLAFSAGDEEKLEAHRRDLAQRLDALGRDRSKLVEQARLLGGARRRSGYRVTAVVAGNGPAELALTYQIGPARWYPSYDLTLNPAQGQVRVALAGQVSQETGEDWTSAALTLSTAVPSQVEAFPNLLTWKIGNRDRFIPTPVAMVTPEVPPPAKPEPPPDRDGDRIADQLDALSERANGRTESAKKLEDKARAIDEAPAGPPPPPEPSPAPAVAAAPMPETMTVEREEVQLTTASGKSAGAFVPPSAVGLAAPGGYRRPAFAADLPASLAGGYDLAFHSAEQETVKSGGGARRVPLLSQLWPVTVERKIFPALNPEAFLVAELASPSPTALPGGTANLFVGDDPAGEAHLDLIAPGQKLTLPLGLDRAVHPIRNVDVVETEKGLISKYEVTQYDVTTEIANPYPQPISVKVLDQWPLTDQKDVESTLLKTAPYAAQDPVKGSLEWRVTIPAGGKTTVGFTYSIRRPKGWRLHQL